MIPITHFPIFDAKLKKNDFFVDETILYQGNHSGRVESWNNVTEILKVDTPKEYSVNQTVRGLTSDTQMVIRSKLDFDMLRSLQVLE